MVHAAQSAHQYSHGAGALNQVNNRQAPARRAQRQVVAVRSTARSAAVAGQRHPWMSTGWERAMPLVREPLSVRPW
jgi:hypothetical protein